MMSHTSRRGATRIAWLIFAASAVLFAAAVAWFTLDARKWFARADEPPLVVYCAAALRPPLEALAQQYEKEYGVHVELQYGASQNLLSAVELSGQGDLYLPADDSYLGLARERKLLAERLPLAHMTPVIAVRKGNPLHIRSLHDLLTGGVRLAQADPDAAAIGHVTRALMMKDGIWDRVKEHTLVFVGTVTEAANAVALDERGPADAAIVWDVTVRQRPNLEAVSVPLFANTPTLVAIGVLTSSKQPAAALRFARYVAASDRGLAKLRDLGYATVDGDPWREGP